MPSEENVGDKRLSCRSFACNRTAKNDTNSRELFNFARTTDHQAVFLERSIQAAGWEGLKKPCELVIVFWCGSVFYDQTVVIRFCSRVCAARNVENLAFAVEKGLDGMVRMHKDSCLISEP